MLSLVIRAATIRDLPSIVEVRLVTLSHQEISGFSAPEFANTISNDGLLKAWDVRNRLNDGLQVFFAENYERLVGYLIFRVEKTYGYIDDIVVHKEEQGKGIGRAIVALRSVAKSQGCQLIKTDTTENANGVPWRSYYFWLKMGYKDTKERKTNYYDVKQIRLMKKLG